MKAKKRAARVLAQIEQMEDEEILLLEPRDTLDQCLVGVAQRFHSTFAVYSMRCVLEVFAEDAPTDDPDYPPDLSAREYFEYNTVGAWVGEGTPAFIIDTED